MADATACASCGHLFPEPAPHVPCPACGSTSRTVRRGGASSGAPATRGARTAALARGIAVTIPPATALTAPGQGEHREVVRHTGAAGRSLTAALLSDGAVTQEVGGRGRHTAEGVDAVGRVLVRRLTRAGGTGGPPAVGKRADVDGIARAGARARRIPVTRADPDPGLWRTRTTVGRMAGGSAPAGRAAAMLRSAIAAKARAIPPRQRGDPVRALDARATPGQAFRPVVQSCRERHGAWTSGWGVLAVWLVGRTEGVTHRLDLGASTADPIV